MTDQEKNIIETLEAKMADCQQRFAVVEENIANIIAQSKELQNQYDQENVKREQIRGEYTGFANLLADLKKNLGVQDKVIIPEEKPVKSESNENKATKKEEVKEDKTLTEDEVNKLKEITKKPAEKKPTAKKQVAKKEQELPDFLKEENQSKK